MPRGVLHELRRFFYDLAGATHPAPVAALLKLVQPERIVFGTDFPPAGPSLDVVKALAQLGFSASDLAAIERGNALKLLPRLALAS